MRAPQQRRRAPQQRRKIVDEALQRRSDAEIVDEALALIKPPADRREAVRAQLVRHIDRLPRLVPKLRAAPPQPPTRKLRSYQKRLLKMRQAGPLGSSEEFRAALDAEIGRVQQECEERRSGKSRDRVAMAVVIFAADFLRGIEPDVRSRIGVSDWRNRMTHDARKYPRVFRRRTSTTGGPWHLLSSLLYEAATDQPGRDHVLFYIGELMAPDLRVPLLPR